MKSIKYISCLLVLCYGLLSVSHAQDHPSLILTVEGVRSIRANKGKAPLFDAELAKAIQEVDDAIREGIDVPVPKDMAGGYTHERHKKNWFVMQKAGVLYQFTAKEKYAEFVKNMLLEYAKLYPTLGLHPTNRSYATGKLFWQCLNDANWLVYVSQAYDCIYNYLSVEERTMLEKDLFRPFADFLSVGNPRFFDRIHNHSTWGNAAVGMIGLVMDDQELIDRSLYGLKKNSIDPNARDNDGGFIRKADQKKTGFLAQMDFSFSPDGYFTEGPYYLRYAIYPFLIFGQSLANKLPELKIMSYRDAIFKKAVYALLYQADANGLFFPINDAQKGMSWQAREVISAVDLAYLHYGRDPGLLSVAQQQGKVTLDEAGFLVARDLALGLKQPITQRSIAFTDGADGKEGGVSILRTSQYPGQELCTVFKYSAQGMGHGHFDKLSYSLYDEGGEVIQDYGAARWVNIDQKGGGRYLPENNSWAKQSIAHNTVVVNETSHYEGDIAKGEAHHPDLFFFNNESEDIQVVSAKDENAYPGVELHRTLVLLKDENLRQPVLLDIYKIQSAAENQYDLPIWFQGHLLSTNFKYQYQTESRSPLGEDHGYQHLWKEALGEAEQENNAKITWFEQGKFYSMTSLVSAGDELIFARIGANDPNFNLRHDPAFIIRKKQKGNTLFASIIEPHGDYNPVEEIPNHPFSIMEEIKLLHDDKQYSIIAFSNKSGKKWTFMLANQNASTEAAHYLRLEDKVYQWQGPFKLIKN